MDISKPSAPEQTLAVLRAHPLESPQAAPALDALRDSADPVLRAASAKRRAELAEALTGALQPADRPLVRWLLSEEIAHLEREGQGATETLYILVAALARFGQPADAFLIWRAREATPETRAGVEAEQVARLGVEAVRRLLRREIADSGPNESAAAAMLRWLDEAEASGALTDLPEYFAWSDERYGVRAAGPV